MLINRPFALSLCIALPVLLHGCGKEGSPAKAGAAPTVDIRIGHVAPLTGSIPHLGKDNENGARLAIEELNAARIMIDGRQANFVLQAEDDQEDEKIAPTVAQKLVDARVAGVVGHLNSGTSIPASSVYAAASIPVITGSSTNPKLTEQGFKTQFRLVGRDDQQGPAIAGYLAGNNKPAVVALIDDKTQYGEGLANEVEKTLKAAGIRTLPREKGDNRKTDWKAILTKLKGSKPDAVFYGGMDNTGGPLLRQARELGMKMVFAFGDGGCTDKMRELAGDASEGLLCSQAGIPAEAADRQFLDNYKKKFNMDPLIYSPFTYDATKLLAAAMQQANSADPAKYLPVLSTLQYRGATGAIAFDAKGDRKDAEMTIFTMKAGRITPIAVIKGGQTQTFEAFKAAGAAAPVIVPAAGADKK